MSATFDWSDAGARAYGCNSTLAALVQSAQQVASNKGYSYTGQQYLAVWACRFSSDPNLAEESVKLWPALNLYGYYPSSVFAIIAIVVFALSGVFHLYQMVKTRRWIFFAAICAAALEVYGWYTRYMSSKDVMYGYIVQLPVLIIAPTFYAGCVYALFYALAAPRDADLMPFMRPKSFCWSIFALEFATLVVQGCGGGIAGTTHSDSVFHIGTIVMTTGTALQVATSALFLVVFLIYFKRLGSYNRESFDHSPDKLKRIFVCVVIMELLFIIRGCYRTVELSEGLYGNLARSQIALILGDAVPMMIVAVMLNCVHPLYTIKSKPLPKAKNESDEELKSFASRV